MEWLKADFHLHSREDQFDFIPYSAFELIDRCATLGYQVLAITNHRRLTFRQDWIPYAEDRGILLIPGVEADIRGRHVLLLNADKEADKIRTFEDLRAYKKSHDVIVVAPHPFHWSFICLHGLLRRHIDLFDAVEIHSFYTRFFNPNKTAQRFATEYKKPLIGNSDCHRLDQLDLTYSMVRADPTISSVLQALRQDQVKVVSSPLTFIEAFNLLHLLRINQLRRMLKRFGRSFAIPDGSSDRLHEQETNVKPQQVRIHK